MGGIIVVDFIDMQSGENKQQLFDKMKEIMTPTGQSIIFFPFQNSD